MDSLVTLYCVVDDFAKNFMPEWRKHLLTSGLKQRQRASRLTPSEIMTLVIHFHQSGYRDFKHYYCNYVQIQLAEYFPALVSYNRFIELIKTILVPLTFFSQTLLGQKTGIYFVDSTVMKACHVKREHQHRVFAGIAKKSKSTLGWFYGFKLHLLINDKGEIIAFKFTSGNVDDRKPVPQLVKQLWGKVFGDKGYVSQKLFDELYKQGIELITKAKKKMQPKTLPLIDRILLRKRAIIESVNDQLKNISQLEHTRHRSIFNFMTNAIAALIAYMVKPKKPSLNLQWTALTVP